MTTHAAPQNTRWNHASTGKNADHVPGVTCANAIAVWSARSAPSRNPKIRIMRGTPRPGPNAIQKARTTPSISCQESSGCALRQGPRPRSCEPERPASSAKAPIATTPARAVIQSVSSANCFPSPMLTIAITQLPDYTITQFLHFPFHAGWRFCMKAVMPSLASSLCISSSR